ncbi:MAG: methyltransferase domain-containing protein, partial [Planctomycetes bacterium]|nr:methyltransferase domain-containing protein [Planctomycetota bacterium]
LQARFRLRGPLLVRLAARRAAHDPILERLPRWVPQEGRVLVAGCGVGLCLARLAQLPALELSAIEHNPRRLNVARSALRPTPVTWIAGDPLTVPLERYAAVLVEDTLTAYGAAAQEQLLARLAEHLEPGGTLILITPPPNGAWGALLRHWACGLGDFPRSLLVPTDLGRVLNRCGLAVTHSQTAEGAWPRFVWVCKRPGPKPEA